VVALVGRIHPLVRGFALMRGFSRSDQKYYCSNEGGAPKLALGKV